MKKKNSPTDRLNKTFNKHSNHYRDIMGQTWGNKGNNETIRIQRTNTETNKTN